MDLYICWIKGSFPFITNQPITFEFHPLNFIPSIYVFINYNYFHSYDSSMVITHSSIKIISYDWVNFVHYVHLIYFDNFDSFGLHSSFFFHIHQCSLIEILPKEIHHFIIPLVFILDYPSSFTICFHNIHSLIFIPCDQSHSFISIKELNLIYMFALPSFINWIFFWKNTTPNPNPLKDYYNIGSISTSTKWIYIFKKGIHFSNWNYIFFHHLL